MAAAPLVKLKHSILVLRDPPRQPPLALKSAETVIICIQSLTHAMTAIPQAKMVAPVNVQLKLAILALEEALHLKTFALKFVEMENFSHMHAMMAT
jgi:hypothetical protein